MEKLSQTLHIASLSYLNVTTLLLSIRSNAFYCGIGVFSTPADRIIGCPVIHSCVKRITSTVMSNINFVKLFYHYKIANEFDNVQSGIIRISVLDVAEFHMFHLVTATYKSE